MIKVENLSKKYGDLVVLKNISTEIKKARLSQLLDHLAPAKVPFLDVLTFLMSRVKEVFLLMAKIF